MKKTGIFFVLIVLMFLIFVDYEGTAKPKKTYEVLKTHDWETADADTEPMNSNYIRGRAKKYGYRVKASGFLNGVTQNGTIYGRSGDAYAKVEVYTDLMKIGDEVNVVSWIRATAARNLIDLPSQEFLKNVGHRPKHRKPSHKHEWGYVQYGVSYKPGIASYVRLHKLRFWEDPVRRPFEHDFDVTSYFHRVGSPTDLPDPNPYIIADIDITSRQFVGAGIGFATFYTPMCEGSDGEHPIPLLEDKCPGAPGATYTTP